MLAVILSACMVNTPTVCRDYKLPVSAYIDPMRCAMDAPPYFARWSEEHPGWEIKRWRCTRADQDDI